MSRTVEVGDKIMVTKVNGDVLEVPHIAVVDAYYREYDTLDIERAINGERTLASGNDEWYPLGEYVSKKFGTDKETPSHVQYNDDALSPSYSDAVRAGMTFAEYTGVNITEETLDFETKEEAVLKGITADSLNFEEDTKEDAVNHPSHYNATDLEVIVKLEDLASKYANPVEAYLVSSAAKYLERAPFKGNKAQDIDKAIWYLTRLRDRMASEN